MFYHRILDKNFRNITHCRSFFVGCKSNLLQKYSFGKFCETTLNADCKFWMLTVLMCKISYKFPNKKFRSMNCSCTTFLFQPHFISCLNDSIQIYGWNPFFLLWSNWSIDSVKTLQDSKVQVQSTWKSANFIFWVWHQILSNSLPIQFI